MRASDRLRTQAVPLLIGVRHFSVGKAACPMLCLEQRWTQWRETSECAQHLLAGRAMIENCNAHSPCVVIGFAYYRASPGCCVTSQPASNPLRTNDGT